jgi:hypothetical protein
MMARGRVHTLGRLTHSASRRASASPSGCASSTPTTEAGRDSPRSASPRGAAHLERGAASSGAAIRPGQAPEQLQPGQPCRTLLCPPLRGVLQWSSPRWLRWEFTPRCLQQRLLAGEGLLQPLPPPTPSTSRLHLQREAGMPQLVLGEGIYLAYSPNYDQDSDDGGGSCGIATV